MTEHAVVIAGGGPTGLMLAGELALAGVDVVIVGRRMSDLDLHTANGPTRVFTLLHDARPVLLNLGKPGGFDISPWANRVRLVDARHDVVWQLPVLGEIAAPAAVLIRPDGHVVWVGHLNQPELPEALATWFGPPVMA
jgi:threonine dehydrogenase-like Zn-dependent dehydrogenase